MPNALAFIGGGLLEGIGRGLVEEGKDKRERALADLEHQRNLERDEKRLEGQRGLLSQRLESDRDLAEKRETGATKRLNLNLGSQEKLAGQASQERMDLASQATKSRERIAAEDRLSREGISAAEMAHRKSEGQLTRNLSAKQLAERLKSAKDLNQNDIDAALARLEAGHGHAETLNQATINAAQARLKAGHGHAETLNQATINAAQERLDAQLGHRKSEGQLTRDLSAKQLAERLKSAKDLNQATINAAQARLKAGHAHAETLNQATINAAQERLDAQLGHDTTSEEDRIIQRHVRTDENGLESINHEGAARELKEKGLMKAAAAQLRQAKAIKDQELRKRAEEFADARVEEQSWTLSSDEIDFKEDGGSRARFRARMVREFIEAEKGGKADVTPAAEGAGPYVGETRPPGHPNAKQAKDGFWYVPDTDRPGTFKRVQRH